MSPPGIRRPDHRGDKAQTLRYQFANGDVSRLDVAVQESDRGSDQNETTSPSV
jgi:hypothetical protein